MRVSAVLFFCFGLGVSGTFVRAAESTAPLLIRNTQPSALIFASPVFGGDRDRFRLTLDHSSQFSGSARCGIETSFDGETTVATLSWNHTTVRGWQFGIDVPWVRHSGGSLDGFIEGYHDLFGFPNAGRERTPRDRLRYRIVTDGVTRLDLDESTQAPGDIRLYAGRTLYDEGGRRLAVRGLVKLPTGDGGELSGSEATDAGLWMEYTQAGLFGLGRLSLSALAGGMVLGEGDLLPEYQREFMPAFHLGFGWRLSPRIELLMQADARGAAFDIPSDILGRTVLQGTLGGRVRLSNGFWLDLAVAEDLRSKSAPDVIFHLSLGHHAP